MSRKHRQAMAHTAEHQDGLVTRRQLNAIGLSERGISHLVAAGTVIVLHPSVYRIAGAPESWEQALSAALLGAGEESWISHRAAGVFWKLEDVTADRPDVLVPHARRVDLVDVTIHRTRVLRLDDVTTRNGIRLTSVARTLVDLAGILTLAHLERALDDARRRRIVKLDQIRACLDSRGPNGVRGWRRLDRLVEQRVGTQPTGSGKETVFLSGLRRRKLPLPIPQYRVLDAAGGFIARPDFSYPDIKLAIEVDGGHHVDPAQWEADLARQNRMTLAGWRFLRFPRTDRKGQREAFATIETAFAAFGEPGGRDPSIELPKRGRSAPRTRPGTRGNARSR